MLHAQTHRDMLEKGRHTAPRKRAHPHSLQPTRTDLQFWQNTVQEGKLAARADEMLRAQVVLVKKVWVVAHLPSTSLLGQFVRTCRASRAVP